LEAFTLQIANDVQYRTLIGEEEIRIVDRKPAGTMVFEAPLLASKDFFALAKAGTQDALTITHGIISGNKVKLDAPKVSLSNPNYQDSSGIQMLSSPIIISPTDAGNDEVVVTVF
jgi:hypothetical protein